jgi:hypothetical protein
MPWGVDASTPLTRTVRFHYESETALKGVERRWEALAPVATQRLSL